MALDNLNTDIYIRPISPSQAFEIIAQMQPRFDLTGLLSQKSAKLIGSGGYGDVYKMEYDGKDICVKQIRFTVGRGKQKVAQVCLVILSCYLSGNVVNAYFTVGSKRGIRVVVT